MITCAIALTLAIPTSVASWSAFGAFEPDNNLDDSSFMYTDAPTVDQNRIYFNAFTVEALGIVSLGSSANSGTLESRDQAVGLEGYIAVLGNWVDCNGDGFVGFGDQGLTEYDSKLLLDTSICPPQTGDVDHWDGHSHNYNGWVVELVPVGTDGGQPSASAASTTDPKDNKYDDRVIRDSEARIWGDYGKPTDIQGTPVPTCPIEPFPRGTWQSTGGVLNYVNCDLGTNARWNSVWSNEITVNLPLNQGSQTLPGPGDPLNLRFHDVNDSKSGVLGSFQTFGTEDSHKAAVYVMDCSQPAAFNSTNTLNAENDALGQPLSPDTVNTADPGITIFQPSPHTGDLSDPTVPGQLNETNEETGDATGGSNNGPGSNCNTSDDAGHDFYGTLRESDFEGTAVAPKGKVQSDFNFEYEDNDVLNMTPRGSFGLDDCGNAYTNLVSPTGDNLVPEDTCPEQNTGVDALHPGHAGSSANFAGVFKDWFSRGVLVGVIPNTVRTNIDTKNGTADPKPDDPFYISFYAHVGAATLSRGFTTPGGLGKYGSTQCGSFTSGLHGGWDCAAADWNLNSDGTSQKQVAGGDSYPGMEYNLRDVDCQDGSNNAGVPTGVPAFGTGACPAYGS